MIQARCPTCGKATSGATLGDLPHFPFCSSRCRLIDLGRWADEAHVIPVQQKPADDESADEDED